MLICCVIRSMATARTGTVAFFGAKVETMTADGKEPRQARDDSHVRACVAVRSPPPPRRLPVELRTAADPPPPQCGHPSARSGRAIEGLGGPLLFR